MAQANYDFFICEGNSGEHRKCRVCGDKCRVTRNVFGPTNYISAIAKKPTRHDSFICPHSDDTWHRKALKIAVAIDQNPSKRISEMMKSDLADLVQENLEDD